MEIVGAHPVFIDAVNSRVLGPPVAVETGGPAPPFVVGLPAPLPETKEITVPLAWLRAVGLPPVCPVTGETVPGRIKQYVPLVPNSSNPANWAALAGVSLVVAVAATLAGDRLLVGTLILPIGYLVGRAALVILVNRSRHVVVDLPVAAAQSRAVAELRAIVTRFAVGVVLLMVTEFAPETRPVLMTVVATTIAGLYLVAPRSPQAFSIGLTGDGSSVRFTQAHSQFVRAVGESLAGSESTGVWGLEGQAPRPTLGGPIRP